MLVCTLTGNLRTYIVWLSRYNFQVIGKVDMQLECWEVMLFNHSSYKHVYMYFNATVNYFSLAMFKYYY